MQKRRWVLSSSLWLVSSVFASDQLIVHNNTRQNTTIRYTLNDHPHVLHAHAHRHVADVPAADELAGTYQVTQITSGELGQLISDCDHLVLGQPYHGVTLVFNEQQKVVRCVAKTIS